MQNKIFLFLLILSFIFLSFADVPMTVNYQGKLFDSGTGGPIDGTRAIGYKLYEDTDDDGWEDTDPVVWSKTPANVSISDGLFSDKLDFTGSISIFNTSHNLYLEVYVGPEDATTFSECTALSSPEQFRSTPYAFYAQNAINAANLQSGTSANQTLRWDGSQWVPSDALTNDGTDISTTGNLTVGNDLTVSGNDISGGASGQLYIRSNGSVRVDLDDDGGDSESFKIVNNSNNIVFEVTEAGNVDAEGNATFDGNLTLSGDSRYISSGDALDIRGNSGIDVYIDYDESGTGSQFYVKTLSSGSDVNLFRVDEDGDAQVYRKLNIVPQSSEPSGAAGDLYVKQVGSAADTLKFYDGSSWRAVAVGDVANSLQGAYDGGNTIDVNSSNSVEIYNGGDATTPLVVTSSVGGNEAAYFGNSASGNAIKTGGGSNSGNIWMETGNLTVDAGNITVDGYIYARDGSSNKFSVDGNTGNTWTAGNIYMENNYSIYAKDAGGTDRKILTLLDGSDHTLFDLYGNDMYIRDQSGNNIIQFSGGTDQLIWAWGSIVDANVGTDNIGSDANYFNNLYLDNQIIWKGTNDGTLQTASLTAARTWTLPDATGTIALTNNTDNYQYWTASDGTNNTNITSTSALTYSGSGGITTSLSGNTLTIDGSGISGSQWTDAGNYLRPSDDANELTKIYETAEPTYRVRGYSRVTTGDYAFGDLGYYGTAIGGTSRHIGVYGNSGSGTDNVAVAGRYSSGRYGYIAGQRYAIYGKFDEDATGLTSTMAGYFINDDDENNSSYSKFGVYGDVTADYGTKYAIYGSSEGDGTNYGVYGKATVSGENNYGIYGEAANGTSNNYGVYGVKSDDNNIGYLGGADYGVYGSVNAGGEYGIYGKNSSTSTSADYGAVRGELTGGGHSAVGILAFYDNAATDKEVGVYGEGGDYGVYGKYDDDNYGYIGTEHTGVYGRATTPSDATYNAGLYGYATNTGAARAYGVYASGTDAGGRFNPGVIFNPQAGSTPWATKGMQYMDDDDNTMYYYNGSAWVSMSGGGGGTPGGSDGQIQYNNGGSFGGAADFYYDDANDRVGIGTTSPSYKLDVHESTNSMPAIVGTATGDNSIGVGGYSQGTSGDCYGIYGLANGSGADNNYGVYGTASGGTSNYGVYGTTDNATGSGGYFVNTASSGAGTALYADGRCSGLYATAGVSGYQTYVIEAELKSGSDRGAAVYAHGIAGDSHCKATLAEENIAGTGIVAPNGWDAGVAGEGDTVGVYGKSNKWAGYFDGNGYFSGNVGIGATSPSYKLDVSGTGRFSGDLTAASNLTIGNMLNATATWGENARTQGICIIPEGTVSDDGSGNLTFGSTVIVMNPAAGSWIRVASGTYTLGTWGYLYVDIPPTGTRGTTVTPSVGTWTDGDRNYDNRDRIILAQRMGNGAIFTRFTQPANAPTGDVPTNAVYWIDAGTYIYPEDNASAKVYDSGETYGYYYDGSSNQFAGYFSSSASNNAGCVGSRTSTLPTIANSDVFPYNTTDGMTKTGVLGVGDLYMGVTGHAIWDAGVRGIGIDDYGTDDGTNSSWPICGVIGEVIGDGTDDYGQQGVIGWQAAPAGNANYCHGVYGRTSQTGYMSAGVVGQYNDNVGTLVSGYENGTTWGALGLDDGGGLGVQLANAGDSYTTLTDGAGLIGNSINCGVFGYGIDNGTADDPSNGGYFMTDDPDGSSAGVVGDQGSGGWGVYSFGPMNVHESSDPEIDFYEEGTDTWGGIRWNGSNMQYSDDGALSTWTNFGSGGGGSEWTDAGNYVYPNENSNARVYEDNSDYGFYYSGAAKYGMYGYSSSSTAGASGVYGYSSTSTDGTDVSYSSSMNAVLGHCLYGNAYHYGVHGDTYNSDGSPTAGVIGTFTSSSSDWGALAYKHTDGSLWAGYFNGNGYFAGNVGIGTTSPGYKLDVNGGVRVQSLAAGATNTVVTHSSGVLQTRTIDSRVWGSSLTDGSGSANYVAKWSDANTLTNSTIIYDDGTNVGIGTTSPGYKLHIQNTGGASSAKIGYSSSYTDNRLFFGDGNYVYVGELNADDRLYLRGSSISIDIGGNLGSSGQVLKSNGTTLYWADDETGGGGGTPGGYDGTIQFNNSGSFGGDSALVWDRGDSTLIIKAASVGDGLKIEGDTYGCPVIVLKNTNTYGSMVYGFGTSGDTYYAGVEFEIDSSSTIVNKMILYNNNPGAIEFAINPGGGTQTLMRMPPDASRVSMLKPLSLDYSRTYITAYDGSSNHWITTGGTEPGSCFMSFSGTGGGNATAVNIAPGGGTGLYVNSSQNVGIGTTSPGYKLHVVGGDVKIGNSSGDNRKLYFGDGSYIWIGEYSDDHLRLHSSSLSIEIGGDLGSSGEVLKSNGSTVYWGTDNTGGGGGEWTDNGSYLSPSDGGVFRVYEDGSYVTYWSGSSTNLNRHYTYNSADQDGSSYSSQRTCYYGYNLWGNLYSATVYGKSYLDYGRSSGVFGSNSGASVWGALGYKNSSSSTYGGYFTSYTSGSGLLRSAGESGIIGPQINIGIGAWGDLFAANFHGKVYGTYIEGGRYALYTHGDNYTDGLDIHFQDIGKDTMAVLYSNVSTDATVMASGVGELHNGVAEIKFPEKFSKTLSLSEPAIVTITPIGPCNGVYVESSNNKGFVVRELNSGNSNVRFNWIAVGKRAGYENPQLPAEVVASDYTEKISRGLHNDADTETDGEGLYFQNGELFVGKHPSTIPSEELISLKNEFTENPSAHTYQEWVNLFASVGSKFGISQQEFEDMIEQDTPKPMFDSYGNQIPPEWVDELREAGVPMFTYEEMMKMRKQRYLKQAKEKQKLEEMKEKINNEENKLPNEEKPIEK